MTDRIVSNLVANLDANVLPKKLTAKGKVGIYTYLIMYSRASVVWIFNVRTNEFNKTAAEQFVSDIRQGYKSIRTVRFTSNSIEIVLLPKHFANESVQLSNKINFFLSTNGYTPCCMHCGNTDYLNTYTLPNKVGALILCEQSAFEYNSHQQKQDLENDQKEERVTFGTLGAVLGTIPGVAIYLILYVFNLLAAISGLVVIMGSMFLYERFATKFSKRGLIISILVSLFAVAIVAPWISYTIALYMYNDEFNQAGLFVTFIETPFVVLSYSELLSGYIQDLLWSIGLGVIGSFSYTKNKLLNVTSSKTLEKIEA